uniref:Wall-associated receptor kinase galacturonan-binding domain-containing protein n=1 Tax=Ananas comosus var. bracteatus TaxID=296719 RepID=A0A6V7Q5A9_ANACO|nr:unnamed protein product [Ananas comosus var. bracteatus]
MPLCVILLLLLLPAIVSAGVPAVDLEAANCSPSSCGRLHNIHYPFRLNTDPPQCGQPQSTLRCEDNKAILEYGAEKYYVTNISYDSWGVNLINANLMNRSCSLPPPSHLFDFSIFEGLNYQRGNFACFVNCTRPIQHQLYWPVPCLSRNVNDVHVYVMIGSLRCDVMRLEPSCGFLSEVPVTAAAVMNSTVDIFELLREEFVVSWYWAELAWYVTKDAEYKIIHYCLNESSR